MSQYKVSILLCSFVFSLLLADGQSPAQNRDEIPVRTSFHDTIAELKITGTVINIFNEPVDSVIIKAVTKNDSDSAYSDDRGRFQLSLSPNRPGSGDTTIQVCFFRYDYRSHDTIITISSATSTGEITAIMVPKYKILLKGRIRTGNSLLEDVSVSVSRADETTHLKTLGCYTDSAGYWNCLYHGMFKTEIVTENPEDSIYLYFTKQGYQTFCYRFKFSEYSGDLLELKMRFADSIPGLPVNNIALKFANTFVKNARWYFNLSYYRQFFPGRFNRLAAGWDVSSMTYRFENKVNSTQGIDVQEFKDTYVTFFTGPSLMVYASKPHVRHFSTYMGSSFLISLNKKEFVLRPFAGTRFFMDMRKSICVELQYFKYNLDVREYAFNFLGNATSTDKTKTSRNLTVNLGLQVNF